MPRAAIVLLVLIGLSACSAPGRPDDPPADLGNFRLGHDVVVAPDPVRGPASREATAAEWIEALQSAVDARFRPYQGGRLYHFGISVEGYVLARPGVPVIAAPKSLLIFKLTVWDDAAGAKLGARQFIVTEALSEETIVGSDTRAAKSSRWKTSAATPPRGSRNGWCSRRRKRAGSRMPSPMMPTSPPTRPHQSRSPSERRCGKWPEGRAKAQVSLDLSRTTQ